MGLCHALSKEHEGTPLPFAPWCRKKTPDPADKAAPGKSTTPTPKRVRRSNRNRPNSLSLWDLVRGVGVIYENPSWDDRQWKLIKASLSQTGCQAVARGPRNQRKPQKKRRFWARNQWEGERAGSYLPRNCFTGAVHQLIQSRGVKGLFAPWFPCQLKYPQMSKTHTTPLEKKSTSQNSTVVLISSNNWTLRFQVLVTSTIGRVVGIVVYLLRLPPQRPVKEAEMFGRLVKQLHGCGWEYQRMGCTKWSWWLTTAWKDGMGYPNNCRETRHFGWHDIMAWFEAPGSQRKGSRSKDLVVDGPKRLSASF